MATGTNRLVQSANRKEMCPHEKLKLSTPTDQSAELCQSMSAPPHMTAPPIGSVQLGGKAKSGRPFHLVIPAPCLRIYGLAYRTQDSQRGPLVLFHKVVAKAHEAANCCRCRVQNGRLVLVHDFPWSPSIWECRDSLENDLACSVQQRPVSHIGVPCCTQEMCQSHFL